MPVSDIGIDLGTKNCLVYSTGKGLVLQEPSIVIYDKDTEKIKSDGWSCDFQYGSDSSDSTGCDR